MNSGFLQTGVFIPGMLGLFNSAWMLWWCLAAAIPILLHLWRRQQRHETRWAAMLFLQAAIQRHAHRMRLQRILLLALRVLPLLLIGLALADPLAPWQRDRSTSSQPVHRILVVDVSSSMRATIAEGGGGRTCMDAARDAMRQLIAAATPGDAISLVAMAETSDLIAETPLLDKQEALSEIERLAPKDVPARFGNSVVLISRYLARLEETNPDWAQWRHEAVWVSDMSKTTWQEAVGAESTKQLKTLSHRVALRLVPVGREAGIDQRINLAVTDLRLREKLPTTNAMLNAEATIRAFGGAGLKQGEATAKAVFQLDGEVVGERSLRVPHQGEQQVSAPIVAQTDGDHWLRVEIQYTEKDPLALDDSRSHCFHTRATLRALCIQGRSGEARELALALSPLDDSPIATTVAPETALLEEELGEFDCVALVNVARIGVDEARLLAQYVRSGGALLVFLGDQVQPDSYNESMDSAAFLPCRIGAEKTLRQGINPLEFRHPMLEVFRGFEKSGLRSTPVSRYFQVSPVDGATPVFVGARSSDVLAVEHRYGDGRCLLFATAGSSLSRYSDGEAWTELPQWPSFLPLVQQAFLFLTRQDATRFDALVGRELGGYLPEKYSGVSQLTMQAPNGNRRQLGLNEQAHWSFSETVEAGVYQVDAGEARYFRAVNVDVVESDLTQISDDVLPSEFNREQASQRANAPAATQSYRWLLALAAVFLLLECWHVNRGSAGGRQAGHALSPLAASGAKVTAGESP